MADTLPEGWSRDKPVDLPEGWSRTPQSRASPDTRYLEEKSPQSVSLIDLPAAARSAKGAAKTLTGWGVGAGQLASDLDPTGTLGRVGSTAPAQAVKRWAMSPAESVAEETGRFLPYFAPGGQVSGMTRLGRGTLGGVTLGLVAPTESGSLGSHFAGAAAGGLLGAAFGALGGKAGKLEDFNRAAYRYALEPLEKYGVKIPSKAGPEGMNAVFEQIDPLMGQRGPIGQAARDAYQRFSELRNAASEGWVNPQTIITQRYASMGPTYDTNEPLLQMAERARGAGTGGGFHWPHWGWHVVPGLGTAGWVAAAAARAAGHTGPGRAVRGVTSSAAPGLAGAVESAGEQEINPRQGQ